MGLHSKAKPLDCAAMQTERISRRSALTQAGLLAGAALTSLKLSPSAAKAAEEKPEAKAGFVYCLNTGTIRGQKLGLAKEIETAAKAGYQGFEPWIEAIDQYARGGGSLKDLRKQISDLGLTVEGAIGFAEWVVDDEGRRAAGLERFKRDMDLVAQIGGKRVAAPPVGANNQSSPSLDLMKAAERYRALCELGDKMGVVPQLELWGSSKNIHTLSEAAFVVVASGHPKGCVLADVFHMYKGGSDFGGLRLLSSQALQVFHMNDYPADPPRERANDSHRVFPGDGVAPMKQIVQHLRASGGRTVLSLELFNQKYYRQDALDVAKAGLEKMKAAVALAG
jgi:2-keto-myo-inositol isomerase